MTVWPIRSSHSFFYLFATCILCWVAYTCVSILNYNEGVASGVKNDLLLYFSTNERIATDIEKTLSERSISPNTNQAFPLVKDEAIGLEGLNIMPGKYSTFSGAFIAQGNVRAIPFNLSDFLHRLDQFWTEEDRNASPKAFFTYYGAGQEFAYIKSRLHLTSKPPEFTPLRYRRTDVPTDYQSSFLTSIEQAYPKGTDVVILVTPVFANEQLIGDLGMTFDLRQLMLDSLGPWLSQYMGLDISFRGKTYAIGEDRFLPFIFNKQITFHDITITAYIKTIYITQYVLPWFVSMLLIMLMVYYVLEKHKRAAIRFSSLSKTDELTGLYNKRILNELESIGMSSGTLFYIDINDFKAINDTHGHNIGDSAIRYVASGIKNCMRASDVCVRVGGDEFLIVSNELALNPEKVVQRLRSAISGASFMQGITITVSIGYCVFDDLDDFNSALHQADKHMYSNKAQFRSEVSVLK